MIYKTNDIQIYMEMNISKLKHNEGFKETLLQCLN